MTGKAAPVHPRLTPKETPEADQIQLFIAKNGVTKPTPKQERRYARKEQRDRGLLTASNPSAYRFRPGSEAFSHRSSPMSEGYTLDHKPLPLEKLTGRYAEELPAPKPTPPPPPAPVILIPGVCQECQKRLSRRTRSDTKSCSEACKKALQRKRKAREEAERVFKKTALEIAQNTGAGNLVEDYYQTASLMSTENVTFLGTPYGMVAIEDVPGAAGLPSKMFPVRPRRRYLAKTGSAGALYFAGQYCPQRSIIPRIAT